MLQFKTYRVYVLMARYNNLIIKIKYYFYSKFIQNIKGT